MGADMLLAGLPAAEMTDNRRKRLHEIVKSLTDNDLTDDLLDDDLAGNGSREFADEREDARADLYQHVELLDDAANRRDVAMLRLPHMPYTMLLTGGMSWGDSPTETFDTFAALAKVEPIPRQLEQWAQEDAGSSPPAFDAQVPAKEESALAVLKEFTDDLRAAYGTVDGDAIDEDRLDWPDLAATYHKAMGVLHRRVRDASSGEEPS